MLRVNQKQMFIVLYLLTKYILPRNDDFLLSAILVTFFTVYNCSPYSITKHLEMICLWRRCAMWRLLIYLLIPGHWWWTGMGILILHFNLLLSDYRGEVGGWYWVVDDELNLLLYISSWADVWPFSCLSCGCYISNIWDNILYIYERNRRCDASALTVQQTHTLRRTSE